MFEMLIVCMYAFEVINTLLDLGSISLAYTRYIIYLVYQTKTYIPGRYILQYLTSRC
jgi:hypothetical protein